MCKGNFLFRYFLIIQKSYVEERMYVKRSSHNFILKTGNMVCFRSKRWVNHSKEKCF